MSEVKLFLLNTLDIIIGKVEDDIIKDACRVMTIQKGQAVVSLFMGFTGEIENGFDLKRVHLKILSIQTPNKPLEEAYLKYISGERQQKSNIIMPKRVLN